MSKVSTHSATVWRTTRLRLVALLTFATLAMGGVFLAEGQAAVQTWINSTAYGHCFFIAPIAAFLAWERREVITVTPIRPLPWVGLLVLPLGMVWLVAERIGLMEGQQLTAFVSLQVLIFGAVGWRLYRAMAVPLLYLVFAVPFGAFITPVLQHFTAQFIDVGLDIFGITHFSDGNVVDINAGRFFVAEACAGLRFLIASIAFGALYACMIYRSAWKRAAFILASVVIPIIANGFRALGIVVLGDYLGSAEAAAVDHVLYGWIFFSIVILLLIIAGLPFREDGLSLDLPNLVPDARHPIRQSAICVAIALVLSTLAPAWTIWTAQERRVVAMEPTNAVGCLPQLLSADPGKHWLYNCPIAAGAIDHLELRVDILPLHSNAGALPRLRRAIIDDAAAESSDVRTVINTPTAFWQEIATHEPDQLGVVAGWVDGAPAHGGWQQRLYRARHSIAGDTPAPMLISLVTPPAIKALTASQVMQIQQAMAGLLERNQIFVDELVRANAALD